MEAIRPLVGVEEPPVEGAKFREPEVPTTKQEKLAKGRFGQPNLPFLFCSVLTALCLFTLDSFSSSASAQPQDVQSRIQDAIDRARKSIETGQPPERREDEAQPQTSSPTDVASSQASAIQTATPSTQAIGKIDRLEAERFYRGQLPKESKFKSYQEWHKEHSVVSLIVNGADPAHLSKLLLEFLDLRKRRAIVLKEITIVHPAQAVSRALEENPRKLNENDQENLPPQLLRVFKYLLTPVAQGGQGFFSTTSSADSFSASDGDFEYSPVWRIRNASGTFLFEGRDAVSDLFSTDGEFRGERGALTGDSPKSDERHEVVQSRVSLNALPKWKTTMDQKTFSIAKEKLKQMGISISDDAYPAAEDQVAGGSGAIVLKADSDNLPQGYNTFDYLPTCRESKTIVNTLSDFLGFEFDIVFVDPNSSADAERAFSTGALPVPYIPTAFFNPYTRDESVFQELARMWNVRCLPTRLRIVNGIMTSRSEYREGKNAFESIPQEK